MNIKNAFDIDINCIDQLTSIIANNKNKPEVPTTGGVLTSAAGGDSDNAWGRTGEALGAGAKIYG